jgi:hypothetical protein
MVGKSRSEAWLQRQVMSVMICRQVLNQGEMPRLTPSLTQHAPAVNVLVVVGTERLSVEMNKLMNTNKTAPPP